MTVAVSTLTNITVCGPVIPEQCTPKLIFSRQSPGAGLMLGQQHRRRLPGYYAYLVGGGAQLHCWFNADLTDLERGVPAE